MKTTEIPKGYRLIKCEGMYRVQRKWIFWWITLLGLSTPFRPYEADHREAAVIFAYLDFESRKRSKPKAWRVVDEE